MLLNMCSCMHVCVGVSSYWWSTFWPLAAARFRTECWSVFSNLIVRTIWHVPNWAENPIQYGLTLLHRKVSLRFELVLRIFVVNGVEIRMPLDLADQSFQVLCTSRVFLGRKVICPYMCESHTRTDMQTHSAYCKVRHSSAC